MMLHVVPEELKQLVSSCYEYEDLMAYLERVSKISGVDIGKIQILVQRIMAEYMKVIKLREKDEKILGEVKKDIESALSNWFDKQGNIKDLSQPFLMSMERNQLHFHLPLFSTPSTGFIHSRIYQSLVESYRTTYSKGLFNVEELGHYVPEREWSQLAKKIHPELCNACAEFEEYLEHALKVYPYFAKQDDGFLRYGEKVFEEYLKIVRGKDAVLESIKTLADMVAFVHAIYYYLEMARVKHESEFLMIFVTSTKNKAGIFPEVARDTKGDFGIKLPPKGPPEE